MFYQTSRNLGLLLGALLINAGMVAAEPTRIEVAVLAVGAKFIGEQMGGVQVLIHDAEGNQMAEGIIEGPTGETNRIMQATQAHPEVALANNASVSFELDLERPTRLSVKATGPLGYPAQQRSTKTEVLAFPGEHMTGERSLMLSLSGLIIDPESVELSSAGGSALVSFMMACGCPIVPGGLWDFSDYRLEAEVELDCDATRQASFEHAGDNRYRLAVEESPQPVTAVRARAISTVHPQLSGALTLWESDRCTPAEAFSE
ncbi:MAG: hypothetical protein R3200_10995 [Xanthomonadales bacterium]|nr:hypothetical protein [Xanthomonadales bacterium]